MGLALRKHLSVRFFTTGVVTEIYGFGLTGKFGIYLSVSQLFDPTKELISPDTIGHDNPTSVDKWVFWLETLLAEDFLLDKWEKKEMIQ